MHSYRFIWLCVMWLSLSSADFASRRKSSKTSRHPSEKLKEFTVNFKDYVYKNDPGKKVALTFTASSAKALKKILTPEYVEKLFKSKPDLFKKKSKHKKEKKKLNGKVKDGFKIVVLEEDENLEKLEMKNKLKVSELDVLIKKEILSQEKIKLKILEMLLKEKQGKVVTFKSSEDFKENFENSTTNTTTKTLTETPFIDLTRFGRIFLNDVLKV